MAFKMTDISHSKDPEDAAPTLNPDVDRAKFSEAFRRTGRIHIPNVLTDTSARRLLVALERDTPWNLHFNEGKESRDLVSVSSEDHQKLAIAAWERAHSGFQYFFHRHYLTRRGEPYPDTNHYFAKLVAFMTGQNFLAFMGEVTGLTSLTWMNMIATLYKPLDFLTFHNDVPPDDRLIAYVLNMTPNWRPDWGGALQFFDSKDHIEEGYLPTFNSLNIFRVPKFHSVAQVAAFGGLRYSVSGWFHGGKPPDPRRAE